MQSYLVAEEEGVESWDLPLLKGHEAVFSQLQPYVTVGLVVVCMTTVVCMTSPYGQKGSVMFYSIERRSMKSSLAAMDTSLGGLHFLVQECNEVMTKGLREQGKRARIPVVITDLCSPLTAPPAALSSEFRPSFRRFG